MKTVATAKNKSIFFAIQDAERPSTRIRVLNLLPALAEAGFDSECGNMPRGAVARYRFFRNMRRYDLVFLQKKLLSPVQFMILRQFSRKLAFDFDDAIFLRDASNRADDCTRVWKSATRRLKFGFTARHSDLMIAGNSYLAAEARRYNTNVLTLPSAIPMSGKHPARRDFPENPIPVIGWIGSAGTLKYLELICPVLQELAAMRSFILRIVCDQAYDLDGVQCENVKWQLQRQDEEVAKFDIGIMPLYDTPWSRGKCSYKLLQYMAAGVPFVASAVGMNVEVGAADTTGFAVASQQEFLERLQELLDHRELRYQLGDCGRATCAEQYSVATIADRMAAKLHELVRQ